MNIKVCSRAGPERLRGALQAALAVLAAGALAGPWAHAAGFALPAKQRAAVQVPSPGGGRALLRFERIAVPVPGPGQVLIRVYAASINHVDAVRFMHGSAFGASGPHVPGLDVAGVIVAVGAGLSDRREGMPVFAIVAPGTGGALNGAFAHYALARAASTARKPARLTYAQAAGLGVVGVTALRTVNEGQVHAGERVLITGIAGGVGSSAAQIAVARGARVLGTALPRHDAYLHRIGVRRVIDYRQPGLARRAGRVDVIIDTIGGREALQAFRALGPGGRFVSIARAPVTGPQCAAAHVICLGSPGPAGRAPGKVIRRVAALARQGSLAIHVERIFPLARAAAALEYSARDHTEGKVIIAVTDAARRRR